MTKPTSKTPPPKDIAETILIKYPRFRTILDALQECYDSYETKAQPTCKALLGPSGAGKSTVGTYFRDKHLPAEGTGVTEMSAHFMTVPPQVTLRSFAEEFLISLKDPYPSRGSAAALGSRIDRAIGKDDGGHGIRLIILNECQRFADSRWVVLYDCANFLRERIEKSGSSFALLGLESTSELIDQNEQLQRLFEETIQVDPFKWDNEDDQTEFIGILNSLRTSLSGAYSFPRDFTEPDLAFRLCYASFGLIGYLMTIIRGAAEGARKAGKREIDRALLSAAYAKHVRGKDTRIPNPILAKGFDPGNAPPVVLPRDRAELRRSTSRERQKRAPRLSARTAVGM